MNQIDHARFWVVAALVVGIAVAILILLAACETPLRAL